MRFSPPLRASPPFTPFHPFVNWVGVKICACIKSSMLGNDIYSFDEVLKHCPVNEDVEFIYQGDLFTDKMGTSAGENLIDGDSYDEEIQTALEESNGDKEYAFFPENHRCGELGTSAYAAAELLTGEEFEGVSGKYFSMSTEPAKSSELSYSVEDAREFWEESEKLSVLRRK